MGDFENRRRGAFPCIDAAWAGTAVVLAAGAGQGGTAQLAAGGGGQAVPAWWRAVPAWWQPAWWHVQCTEAAAPDPSAAAAGTGAAAGRNTAALRTAITRAVGPDGSARARWQLEDLV